MNLFNLHTHQQQTNAIYNAGLEDANSGMISRGLHPWDLSESSINQFEELKTKCHTQNVVAIGETGLDKLCEVSWELQNLVFKWHIELAEELDKPLIIHCVRSYNECEVMLKSVTIPVVFHDYNKGEGVLRQFLKHSHYYFSLGKALLRSDFEKVIYNLPLDRLFIETDDSQLNIEDLYLTVARVKDISLQELSNQIEENKKKVFGI